MSVVRSTWCHWCRRETEHENVTGEPEIRCRECEHTRKGSVGIP